MLCVFTVCVRCLFEGLSLDYYYASLVMPLDYHVKSAFCLFAIRCSKFWLPCAKRILYKAYNYAGGERPALTVPRAYNYCYHFLGPALLPLNLISELVSSAQVLLNLLLKVLTHFSFSQR
jgi:hypothetical protein